jgi:hypothetical protein
MDRGQKREACAWEDRKKNMEDKKGLIENNNGKSMSFR